MDTGQEEPSFYCVERDSFIQFGPEPYQQVDIGADQLVYRLPGLMPWLRYQLKVTGYWDGEDEIREQLDIDGRDQKLIKLTPGLPETLNIWISPAAYKEDRSVDVSLTLVRGEWAVTGPMILYEFETEEGGDGGSQSAPAAKFQPEPGSLSLSQNYPNPFGAGGTNISFTVNHEPCHVSLRVYDVAGRVVRALADHKRDPGRYRVTWDGKDSEGRRVTSGVYFYSLQTSTLSSTKKMVVLR